MSCNRQCYDPADPWFEHADCSTCSGKDDGAPLAVQQFRLKHWTPHAETQPAMPRPAVEFLEDKAP